MAESARTILICSCEETMPLDESSLRRACRGSEVIAGRQLCRAELDRFRTAAASGAPLTVGCTQEAPRFAEMADEVGGEHDIRYVNIRENAGWAATAHEAGPKMTALIAAAAEPVPSFSYVSLTSDGVVLIYGRDEVAIETADLLKEHLDVTVLVKLPAEITPRPVTEFPIASGTIRTAKGYLGAFELTIDNYALPAPSSRDIMKFGAPRDGAISHCDVILDLSGGAPLFPAADLRDGYLRADPGDRAAVLQAAFEARDLVGTFDKPRYIDFSAELCVHSRSGIIGCTRCLDLCPTSAITPAGDHVVIDAQICAGCGQCAAVCPTGAASYALPPADALMRQLRALLIAYREAGGVRPVILVHDDAHGRPMIDALARFGDGLPANVIPLAVNEVTQFGLENVAAAFAYGALAMRFLLRAKPRHDITGLQKTIALAEPILTGLGFGNGRIATIETDDPDALGEATRAIEPCNGSAQPARFLPMGSKRSVLRFALRELQLAAPEPVDVVPLPAGAPFGKIEIDVKGCTLCLACVSACPTGALLDDPDRPMVRFAEDACVQCGLCEATCPEKVITLIPQLDFRTTNAPARVLHEEEPFHCIRCGKPFGVKSTIERVTAKLADQHWMFKDSPGRLDVIKMCEDCRVAAITETEFDPHSRPRAMRTAEDYLREREERTQIEKGKE